MPLQVLDACERMGRLHSCCALARQLGEVEDQLAVAWRSGGREGPPLAHLQGLKQRLCSDAAVSPRYRPKAPACLAVWHRHTRPRVIAYVMTDEGLALHPQACIGTCTRSTSLR